MWDLGYIRDPVRKHSLIAGKLIFRKRSHRVAGTNEQSGSELVQTLGVIWVWLPEQALVSRQADPQQHEQGHDSVPPRQLLALRARARRVVDGHLVDPVPQAQDAPGDLRLDVEAITPQTKASPERSPHHLLPRIHVLD